MAGKRSDSGKPVYWQYYHRYLVNVCTARFVYPESKFTDSALPRFVDVIKTAVAAVLNDGGFRLASVPVTTTTVLNTATQLVDWMSQSTQH